MIEKWKCDFRKWDLRRSGHPWITAVRIVGPSPWYGIVARQEALIIRHSALALDFSWHGNVIIDLNSIDRRMLTSFVGSNNIKIVMLSCWEVYQPLSCSSQIDMKWGRNGQKQQFWIPFRKIGTGVGQWYVSVTQYY